MSALLLTLVLAAPGKVYAADVNFALQDLEKRCGHFFKAKGIAWGKVKTRFKREAKKVKTDVEHWMLLWRLLMRLKDGHADVYTTEKTKALKWPGTGLDAAPGVAFCANGTKVFVKAVAGDAKRAGVKPGMAVLKVDGLPVARWLKQRIFELEDRNKLYTPHQSRFFAFHFGLAGPDGSRLKLQLKGKKVTLGRKRKGNWIYSGPPVLPEGLKTLGRTYHGKLPSGHGYVYMGKVPGELPEQMDKVLAGIGNVPGMILDFRGCTGGGCDHDAFFGRFIPKGRFTKWGKRYESAGANPYGGPVVVIVDAGVVSSGETLSGIFKEDGRGYMIGPSPTAGMSGRKQMVDLPSGLFRLRVTVSTNKGRFNGNRGVEGIGVPPHELVEYDPKDLEQGVDTLLSYAVTLLKKPLKKVPYQPKRFGWEPPR